MKNLIVAIKGVVLLACITSCDSMVTNVVPPKVDPQLIVYSFLSPEEENILVEVRRTMPIFSGSQTGNDTVVNATVKIIQGSTEQLIPHAGKGQYILQQSNFPLTPGQTYRIEVATPSGELVKGSTTIPMSVVGMDSVNLSEQRGPFGFDVDLLQMKWTDNPAERNFYQVYTANTPFFEDTTNIPPSDFLEIDNQVISDELARNNTMTISVQTFWASEVGDTTKIDVVLANTDEAYYRYHALRLNYAGNNPFSEPTVMYNNVTGGVGVVASYRKSKRTVTLVR